jgi:hypothetical protein
MLPLCAEAVYSHVMAVAAIDPALAFLDISQTIKVISDDQPVAADPR